MMTRRELLELAAKAAGYSIYWHYADECHHILEGSIDRKWNPLVSDGDALRLAVKLECCMVLKAKDSEIEIHTWIHLVGPKAVKSRFKKDRLAATRRAIVRAAAETGMSM